MNDERLRQIRLLHKELKGYGDDRAPDKRVFIRSTVPRAIGDLLTEDVILCYYQPPLQRC